MRPRYSGSIIWSPFWAMISPGRPIDVNEHVHFFERSAFDGELDRRLDAAEDDVLGDVLLPVHRFDEREHRLPLLLAELLLVDGGFLFALLRFGRCLGHRSSLAECLDV